MTKNYYIIGGGPLGMSLALNASLKNKKVYIIESGSELGGLAAPFKFSGDIIDKYYHFYYKSDEYFSKDFFQLAKVSFKIFWKNIKTASYIEKKFYNFDRLISVLKISKFDILKVLYSLIQIKLFKPNNDLDKVSAYLWCKKKFGRNLTKFVWKPLLTSKFGHDWKKISALWLYTRIKIHLGTKDFFTGKSRFAYLTTTYKPVINKLCKIIKRRKSIIYLKTNVNSFQIKKNYITKILTNKKNFIIKNDEKVISTISLSSLKNIKPLSNKLNYLKYFNSVGAAVLVLKLSKKLSDYYWTTVADQSVDFDVIIQQNRLYQNSKYEIVYISKYYSAKSKFSKLANENIYQIFLSGLLKMYPNFKKSEILSKKIFRTNVAAPVPKINSLKLLPNFKTSIGNFFHVGFEHTYPQDRGVSNSINLGKKIFNYLN